MTNAADYLDLGFPEDPGAPGDTSTPDSHSAGPRPNAGEDPDVQWRAETFQLVNWGGFEGRVPFNLHHDSTLISGASGSGKSTLLDAYIAMMMPADTPFNGASSGGAAGRARSPEQRNLISYLRGKTDSTNDADTGRPLDQVLRGQGCATWGAVGMTFVNDRNQRFTAFRVYYVPARATRSTDIVMRMASYDGYLDLADLAPFADEQFTPKSLKAAYAGLLTYLTYESFSNILFTRLGIGAHGDGLKALRLLVRIQSGHQIRTVDQLYKDMVLEEPATYATADRAIDHFNDLEDSYLAMLTEQQKADLLDPITDRHASMLTAQHEVEALDTFGLTRDGDTPLTLWAQRTETVLLDAAAEANRVARREDGERLRIAREDEARLNASLLAAKEEHNRNGGAALELIAQEIEAEQGLRDTRVAKRAALAARTTALAVPLASRADFDRLVADATGFLSTYDAAFQKLTGRRDRCRDEQFPLSQDKSTLAAERASFSGRAGRVPKHLDDLRREAAQAAGLDPGDLPFVAELLDVAPGQSQWRLAIETVLAGSARLMLVPLDHLDAFSRAIDALRLRGRLTFQGAPHTVHRDVSLDPSRVAGKLLFKDSPFSGWVQDHVSDQARNALCVTEATGLAGLGYRVTLAGQTRQGTRGSHGRNDTSNIIGFDNLEAIREIDEKLAAIEVSLRALDQRQAEVNAELGDLDRNRSAYESVGNYQWDDIDVTGVDERIAGLEKRRKAILSADDRLAAIAEQIKGLTKQHETAQERRFGLVQQVKALDAAHSDLVDRQDAANDELDRLESERRVALEDTQADRLDREFAIAADPADPGDLGEFFNNLARLRTRLMGALTAARDEVTKARQDLERIFAMYKTAWEDPNLGQDLASYPDYAEILENIVATGLHERRAEWRKRLTEWSGQDLVPLSHSMEASIEEI
jgi:uncharacterized protein YPO0396